MANSKITDLTATTVLSTTDLFYVVTDVGGTPTSKSVTKGTMDGQAVVTEANLSLADNTTADFSTTKHGFVPKGTNVGAYLKDDGTWTSLPMASQAEAEAGADNTKLITSLRVSQAITALQRGIASQAEAEAGADNTKDMTPLRTAQAIAALNPPFGAWATKADNTVYQAATDGIVCVTLSAASGGDNYGDSKGYTDGSNPPTTVRGQAYASDRDTSSIRLPRQSYTFPVKKNDYYKVVQTTIGGTVTQVIYWLPTGA